MSAVSLQFEGEQRTADMNRVRGGVEASFRNREGRTQLADCREQDGYKLRLSKSEGGVGVIINSGGGVAGGDRIRHSFVAGAGADITLTSQASERIYRAGGAASQVEVGLQVASGARLVWLPQETILYNKAQLSRSFQADVAEDGVLCMAEIAVFGRAAMGETVVSGRFADSWRIRRGGRVVFAENILISGEIAACLARPTLGGGARAIATLVYLAPDAEDQLSNVRDALAAAQSLTAASAWNGMLCMRVLSHSSQSVRHDILLIFEILLRRSRPRSWMT